MPILDISGTRGSRIRFRFPSGSRNLASIGSISVSVPKNRPKTVGSSVSVRTDQALLCIYLQITLNMIIFVKHAFYEIKIENSKLVKSKTMYNVLSPHSHKMWPYKSINNFCAIPLNHDKNYFPFLCLLAFLSR